MSTDNLPESTEPSNADAEPKAPSEAIRPEDRPLLDGVAGGTPTRWDTGGPRERF